MTARTEAEALADARVWLADSAHDLDVLAEILAFVRSGVTLTPEEAALAARCARSIRGDRPVPPMQTFVGAYDQLRLLAEKLEAAS